MTVRRENEISRVILDAAIEVHSVLARPGLLEGVYEEAIAYELALRGLAVERQKAVPGIYKGQRRGSGIGPALEPPRRGHGVGGVQGDDCPQPAVRPTRRSSSPTCVAASAAV